MTRFRKRPTMGIYRDVIHFQAKGCLVYVQIRYTAFWWSPKWYTGQDCWFKVKLMVVNR